MSIRAFIDKFKAAKQSLIDDRERDVLRISLDQIALMKLRVQGSGVQDNGARFAPYSPAYAKERTRRGFQVGFVDYTRTGQFFASISPRITDSNVFGATVVIEPNNERGVTITRAAFSRNGRLVYANSQAEIDFAREANRERFLSKFNFLR